MILVTGANGFIGSAMVWELNRRGLTDVIAVDTVDRKTRDLLAGRQIRKFLLKDEIWDFLALPEAQGLRWIVHMGACSSTTETNWDFLQENNVEYSQRLFQWCAQNGKGLVHASSAATYGAGELGFSDQTDPEKLKPLNLYGKSKLIFDQWALKQKQTPPHWYAVRFFNVFGPNELFKGPMASLVFKACQQIREKGSLGLFRSHHPDYKDGEQVRDFVYVKDVVRWMFELTEKNPPSGIYNMGFGKPRTWLDLAGAVFKAMNREMKIDWMDIPANIRGQYQYFTEADMSKWCAAGMSVPEWPLEKAVQDYVTGFLAQGNRQL